MSSHPARPTVSVSLSYKDPKAALRFLEAAFGFEPTLIVLDAEDNLAHSEMRLGDGVVMVGSEWTERHRSPASIGGLNTQSVHVQLTPEVGGDVDAHCARALAAGATVVQPPETQFYGDRTYRALDPEGHMWTFGQTVSEVSDEAWQAASGLRAVTSL